MNTLETLFSRKSVRTYTCQQLTPEELETVLKAANAAPIARGIYEAVHLTVIQNPQLLAEIDANGAAFFGNPGLTPLYHAPTLILVSSKRPAPGMENVAYSNAAIVVHNMSLAAVELGLGQCCIWGATMALSKNEELVEALHLPEDFVPCCSLILGKTEEKYEQRQIPMERIGCDFIR